MKVITERDCIRSVCRQWARQYTPFELHSPNKRDIYSKLMQLNLETCSAKDVENIIGSASWTRLICNECNQDTDWVLIVGEEPGYESRTACLCAKCLKQASTYLS